MVCAMQRRRRNRYQQRPNGTQLILDFTSPLQKASDTKMVKAGTTMIEPSAKRLRGRPRIGEESLTHSVAVRFPPAIWEQIEEERVETMGSISKSNAIRILAVEAIKARKARRGKP